MSPDVPAVVAVALVLASVLCGATLAVREGWAKGLFVLVLLLLAWTVVSR